MMSHIYFKQHASQVKVIQTVKKEVKIQTQA